MFDSNKITISVISAMQKKLQELLGELYFHAEVKPLLDTGDHWQIAPLMNSPLKTNIETLVAYANGESVDDDFLIPEIIQGICETLFSTPLANSYDIPAHFWADELGQVIMHAQLRMRGDELITISEAATILFGDASEKNLVRVGRFITKGKLVAYVDTDEVNPQRARRVSRSEVTRLTDVG